MEALRNCTPSRCQADHRGESIEPRIRGGVEFIADLHTFAGQTIAREVAGSTAMRLAR